MGGGNSGLWCLPSPYVPFIPGVRSCQEQLPRPRQPLLGCGWKKTNTHLVWNAILVPAADRRFRFSSPPCGHAQSPAATMEASPPPAPQPPRRTASRMASPMGDSHADLAKLLEDVQARIVALKLVWRDRRGMAEAELAPMVPAWRVYFERHFLPFLSTASQQLAAEKAVTHQGPVFHAREVMYTQAVGAVLTVVLSLLAFVHVRVPAFQAQGIAELREALLLCLTRLKPAWVVARNILLFALTQPRLMAGEAWSRVVAPAAAPAAMPASLRMKGMPPGGFAPPHLVLRVPEVAVAPEPATRLPADIPRR